MTSLDLGARAGAAPDATGARRILATFAVALFASAALLFAVQPMFAKMVLPLLGGSPGVWSVATVFFQAMLLVGYLYAHLSARWLGARKGTLLHLGLMALALGAQPIAVSGALGAPPVEGQASWLLGLFALSVGLPFIAVAGNGPLLQAWFARSGHPQARDPYFLYGASNLGSFASLLLYPLIAEPFLTLRDQSLAWSAGFLGLAALVAGGGLLAARAGEAGATAGTVPAAAGPAPSWRARGTWVVLALVPSGLLVAVTSHLATDVASAPFLWVLPLAIYLLTFVAAFRDRRGGARERAALGLALAAPVLVMMQALPINAVAMVVVHLAFFALAALVCHGELHARRPAPERLTEFYLCVSLGGVLGGAFSGLAAPALFDGVAEYPLFVAAAVACLPGTLAGGWRRAGREAVPPVLLAGLALLVGTVLLPSVGPRLSMGLVIVAPVVLLLRARPARFAAAVAALLLTVPVLRDAPTTTFSARSFFGVSRVIESRETGLRLLAHGTTVHGTARLDPADGVTALPEPLAYYYRGSPLHQALEATMASGPAEAGERRYGGERRAGSEHGEGVERRAVGVVGLGTGSFACLVRPTDSLTFFEIDATVVRVARDSGRFTFLSSCRPDAPVVLGDARLTLEGRNAAFDALVIDAFSSDAIPAHLLTEQAIGVYLRALRPDGLIVLHVSNRHVELERVIAAIAGRVGLVGRAQFLPVSAQDEARGLAPSRVVVLARRESNLAALGPAWRPLAPARGVAPWTDDYSNVLGAIWRNYVE